MTNPLYLRAQLAATRLLDRLKRRRWQAYVEVFGNDSPAVAIVLADLRDFCRARQTTFDPDPRLHALIEGRREVWLRIVNQLNLTDAQIAALDSSRPTEADDDE